MLCLILIYYHAKEFHAASVKQQQPIGKNVLRVFSEQSPFTILYSIDHCFFEAC